MRVTVLPVELAGHPDVAAMLQAFYSRSHKGINERLDELHSGSMSIERIRKSLERYYINYNHDSIGDCGNLTVFIEGVSFATAKAIQDHPLYNGQETSSRYIDFSEKPRPEYCDQRYDTWMRLYRDAVPLLMDRFAETMVGADRMALRSAAFDVARGLLPIGAQTQLSWHVSIRTMREHLGFLLAHPIPQVRADAESILEEVGTCFPSLFEDVEPDTGWDWYLEDRQRHVGLSLNPLWKNIEVRDGRVAHSARFGTSMIRMNIDYGSYRDLQRHRRSYIKSVRPTEHLGPESWYMRELPESISAEVRNIWDHSNHDTLTTPMMASVPTLHVATVDQFAYVLNLRSKTTVHPTLREYSHQSARLFTSACPNIAPLFKVDHRPSDYERRGTQTILENGREIA